MSQFGMQNPASARRRSSSPDIFSALAVISSVALLVAVVVMFGAASKVGPDGNAMAIQGDTIKLAAPK
jgi:hypothetical protein